MVPKGKLTRATALRLIEDNETLTDEECQRVVAALRDVFGDGIDWINSGCMIDDKGWNESTCQENPYE